MIDLRSDTVTQPSGEMLEAMMHAVSGDDVYGEDPTVNALQEKMADMFKMEAALYCPSGTMTNQIAINCHTRPGDEVICDQLSHIYQYEGGGIAFNSGCSVHLIRGDRGRITAEQVSDAINARTDVHKAFSKLVSLENTANRGGGSCYNTEEITKIKNVCVQNLLKLHLDGARLFNAIVANNEDPVWYGDTFDSISICLSKGLGAPVGSVLLGNKEFIAHARRVRKLFGGGMRQAGYIAAAGLYAIDHNIERLTDDHAHAKEIGASLLGKPFVSSLLPVETNIIIFSAGGKYTAQQLSAVFRENGILVGSIGTQQLRMVTHLNITSEMVDKVCSLIKKL